MQSVAYVGMDVHQDTIRVAALPEVGETFIDEVTLPNEMGAVRRHFGRLSNQYELRCCYEVSGAGYTLQGQFTDWDIASCVIAPSKVPKRRGDRVKTDRRDAQHLARWLRVGELTEAPIPSREEEQARGLARYRETMMPECVRSKQYVSRFLASRGHVYRGKSNWTHQHHQWLSALDLPVNDQYVLDEHLGLLEYKQARLAAADHQLEEWSRSDLYREATGRLGCLRGIGTLSGMVLASETVDFHRFGRAEALMAFYGLTPSESSSGSRVVHGGITKTGNGGCRRILIEAAWNYQYRPSVGATLRKRQLGQPEHVVAHAWKAQQRLHKTYRRLSQRKNKQVAVTAVARELVGFIWAIMTDACRDASQDASQDASDDAEATIARSAA